MTRLLLLSLLLTACTPSTAHNPGQDLTAPPEDTSVDTGPDILPGIDTRDEIEIQGLVVIANPANVLSFFVEWSTPVLATTGLHVECGDGYVIDLSDEALRLDHRAFVMGFRSGAICQVIARSEDDEGNVGIAGTPLNAGALPDFLPELDLQIHKPEKMQPGWTLFNLSNDFDEPPLLVVIVDDEGRYRWYHQRATNDPGSDTDTRTVPGGVLIGGTHGKIQPGFVDWEGNVLWEKWMNVHHDFRPIGSLGDQDHWLMLTDKVGCGHEHKAGVVFVYDRFTDTKPWEWFACEHIAPPEVTPDWSHLNAVSPFADGEHLLISSRNQNAFYKVEYPSGDVIWKLGRIGDFTWDVPDERFWRQHDPEIQPGGKRFVLFDNGLKNEREWSRALEVEIDEEAMTVKKIWEYIPEPKIFTPIWGDADRLPNGNTLITFGARSKVDRVQIIEVTPEGEEVWRLSPAVKQGVYRSERVVDPVKGYLKGV